MDIDITLREKCNLSTHGGEQEIMGQWEENYGMQIGPVVISELSAADMIVFMQHMFRHLVANGHRFDVVHGKHQDVPQELVAI